MNTPQFTNEFVPISWKRAVRDAILLAIIAVGAAGIANTSILLATIYMLGITIMGVVAFAPYEAARDVETEGFRKTANLHRRWLFKAYTLAVQAAALFLLYMAGYWACIVLWVLLNAVVSQYRIKCETILKRRLANASTTTIPNPPSDTSKAEDQAP